jgi:hypothetical protein
MPYLVSSVSLHALANTTSLGESCDTCNGSQADFNLSKMHAPSEGNLTQFPL